MGENSSQFTNQFIVIFYIPQIPRFSETENVCCNHHKIQTKMTFQNEICLDGKANSVYNDQTALEEQSGAEVIKLFSCSTQLSMKLKMLINIEIAKNFGIFRFNSLKPAIYPANKC